MKLIELLIYNIKFLLMNDCPLCSSYFFQGYQHLDFQIVICSRCYSSFKHLKIHRKFYRFSMLSSSLSKEAKEANKKLKEYVANQKKDPKGQIYKQMLSDCFNQKGQKTQSFTLTTQDSELCSDGLFNPEPNKGELILQKCQEKVMEIASRLQPAKQKLQQTKQIFRQKAVTLKEKYLSLKSEYRNIRAELPEVKGLARQATKKLSSFFKLF